METKSFWCECSRCTAPDYCRYIRCTGCKTSFIPCVYADEGKPTWTCTQCGLRNDIEQKENKLVFRLQALEVRAVEQPLKPLEDLVKDSTEQLSPVHYITIEALETVAQLSASKAASQERMKMFMSRMRGGPRRNIYGASSTYFRTLAAETGLKAVVASECVAAGCPGCYESALLNDGQSFPHEPVYELGSKVFHACTDLMEVPEPKRPSYASALVQRYLPVMRGLFGETDKDVQLIEDKVVNVSSSLLRRRQCSTGRETEDSPTRPHSATKASVLPPKNNKSHQKPRRSTKKKKKGNRSGKK